MLLEERSEMLTKQKELQWDRDQDTKRLNKEVQRLNEKAQQERSEQALHLEKLKEDIKLRYTQELS